MEYSNIDRNLRRSRTQVHVNTDTCAAADTDSGQCSLVFPRSYQNLVFVTFSVKSPCVLLLLPDDCEKLTLLWSGIFAWLKSFRRRPKSLYIVSGFCREKMPTWISMLKQLYRKQKPFHAAFFFFKLKFQLLRTIQSAIKLICISCILLWYKCKLIILLKSRLQ